MSRKDWNSYFMEIAEKVSTRSTCPKIQVGCVITKDKQIISTGYNGLASGLKHCEERDGCLEDSGGHCVSNHAESNALVYARIGLKDSVLYCTHYPCVTCQGLIINAKVGKVFYKEYYEPDVDLFYESDIDVYESMTKGRWKEKNG